MKALIVAISLSVLGTAHAEAISPERIAKELRPQTQSLLKSFQAGATAGDYQAMRNFAYTWSTDAAKQDARAAIVGCAWYALILKRHPTKVHEGDIGNRDVYCGRLNVDQARDAGALLTRLDAS